jgi:hypothetical protein
VNKRSNFEFTPNSYVTLTYEEGRPPNKLCFRHKGPFRVINRIGDNLQLQDLIDEKIQYHHINYARPVDPIDIARKCATEQEFVIEDIIDHSLVNDKKNKDIKYAKRSNIQFLVKWENPGSEDTWEPWNNLLKTEKLVVYLKERNLEKMLPKDKSLIERNKSKDLNFPLEEEREELKMQKEIPNEENEKGMKRKRKKNPKFDHNYI